MDFSLLEAILIDEELTAYLQYMVQMGCELDRHVSERLDTYFNGEINKSELMADLEVEIKIQTGVR